MSTGKTLLTIASTTTAFGAYIFDWNESHVYNPRWTPHAKFHHGQLMSVGLVLGLTSLFYLHRPLAAPSVRHHLEKEYLYTAAWIASIYWITQLTGFFYPDVLPKDPEFGEGAPQIWLSAFHLSFVIVGLFLERKRLNLRKID